MVNRSWKDEMFLESREAMFVECVEDGYGWMKWVDRNVKQTLIVIARKKGDVAMDSGYPETIAAITCSRRGRDRWPRAILPGLRRSLLVRGPGGDSYVFLLSHVCLSSLR